MKRCTLRIILLLVRLCVPLYGKNWAYCDEELGCLPSCVKPPVSAGKREDVVPLGYPYGNDWSTRPYLAPFARESRYQFGQPFTFGYVAVESKPERKKSWRATQRALRCEKNG